MDYHCFQPEIYISDEKESIESVPQTSVNMNMVPLKKRYVNIALLGLIKSSKKRYRCVDPLRLASGAGRISKKSRLNLRTESEHTNPLPQQSRRSLLFKKSSQPRFYLPFENLEAKPLVKWTTWNALNDLREADLDLWSYRQHSETKLHCGLCEASFIFKYELSYWIGIDPVLLFCVFCNQVDVN